MADHSYRGFLVRSAINQGVPKAAVIAGQSRLAVLAGSDLAEAEALARQEIDRLLVDAGSKRRTPDVPSVEEYVRFFQTHTAAPHEVAMLQAHAADPERALTATELAVAAGWTSFSSANVHYGYLGRLVAEFLNLDLPKRDDGTSVYTAALASGSDSDPECEPDGQFRWIMHDELAEAVGLLF